MNPMETVPQKAEEAPEMHEPRLEMASYEKDRLTGLLSRLSGKAKAMVSLALLSTVLSGEARASTSRPSELEKMEDASALAQERMKTFPSVDPRYEVMYVDQGLVKDPLYPDRVIVERRYKIREIASGREKNHYAFVEDTSIDTHADAAEIAPEYFRPLDKSELAALKQEAWFREHGWTETKDGSHGTRVPSSERVEGETEAHTEVRRVYNDKGFDVITVWTIDKTGGEQDYHVARPGTEEYDRYRKVIEDAKNPEPGGND